MENRFGFKDFIVIVLLLALLVTMWLKMVQDDRQWGRFASIQTAIEQQTSDLASLRQAVKDVSLRPAAPATSTTGNAPSPTPNTATATATPSADLAPHKTGKGYNLQGDVFRRQRIAMQKPDYALGDWSVQEFSSAPPTLNPIMIQDLYGMVIAAKVVENLATYDYDTLELVPQLAKSWQEGPDGQSLTVQLREGVTFSDGKPLTADDVVFSFEISKDPEVSDGRSIEFLRMIKKCVKLGPMEVRFEYEKFFESLERSLGLGILPKHLYAKYTKRQIRDNVALLMGTGPYKMPDPEKYTPGQQVVLVRNERYWGPPAPWDRMIYRIIEKESSTLISFRNNEIDGMVPLPEQHVQMLKDPELMKTKQNFVYSSVRLGYQYIAWNQKRKGQPTVFADKRVRQAMTMLIDREAVLKQVFYGFGQLATGPFHPDSDQYDHSIKPWPYDPARAIKLLEEAGFKRDSGGRMLTPDGKPFEPELTYPSGLSIYDNFCIMVRDNLAKAGIALQLRPQKWALLLKSINERDFDAITLRWGGTLEEDPEQAFHSRTIADGDNRNSYSNPELDKLIDQAHVTLDRPQRMKIWQACHRIIHEDQPYTFISFNDAMGWFDGRFKNIVPVKGVGINTVSIWPNPIEWYVPKNQQLRGK